VQQDNMHTKTMHTALPKTANNMSQQMTPVPKGKEDKSDDSKQEKESPWGHGGSQTEGDTNNYQGKP